jgi:hypothetical protein
MCINPSQLAVFLLLGCLSKQATSFKYFITKLADPGDDAAARFVEVYTPDGAGQVFAPDGLQNGDEMFLFRWTNGNSDPQGNPRQLTNDAARVVGADGFFIFCADKDDFEAAYPSSTCDWDIGGNGAADSNGDDQIALVFVDSSTITADDFTIYDIFGVPGQDGTGTVHEF